MISESLFTGKIRLGQSPAGVALQRLGVALEHFPNYVHTTRKASHAHDFIEMNFILRGTVRHWIQEEQYAQRAGSLGIIHLDTEHEIITSAKGAELMNIYCDPVRFHLPQLPPGLAASLPDFLPLHSALRHHRNRVCHLQFSDPAPVQELLHRILTEQKNAAPGHEEAIHSLFRVFLILGLRQLNAMPGAGPLPSGDWQEIEALRRQLDRFYARPQSLDEMAADTGFSRSHLCRRFKEYTGETRWNR